MSKPILVIPKFLWNYIAEFLCYVDKMALKLVSRQMSYVKLDFKSILADRLKDCITEPDKFIDDM